MALERKVSGVQVGRWVRWVLSGIPFAGGHLRALVVSIRLKNGPPSAHRQAQVSTTEAAGASDAGGKGQQVWWQEDSVASSGKPDTTKEKKKTRCRTTNNSGVLFFSGGVTFHAGFHSSQVHTFVPSTLLMHARRADGTLQVTVTLPLLVKLQRAFCIFAFFDGRCSVPSMAVHYFPTGNAMTEGPECLVRMSTRFTLLAGTHRSSLLKRSKCRPRHLNGKITFRLNLHKQSLRETTKNKLERDCRVQASASRSVTTKARELKNHSQPCTCKHSRKRRSPQLQLIETKAQRYLTIKRKEAGTHQSKTNFGTVQSELGRQRERPKRVRPSQNTRPALLQGAFESAPRKRTSPVAPNMRVWDSRGIKCSGPSPSSNPAQHRIIVQSRNKTRTKEKKGNGRVAEVSDQKKKPVQRETQQCISALPPQAS